MKRRLLGILLFFFVGLAPTQGDDMRGLIPKRLTEANRAATVKALSQQEQKRLAAAHAKARQLGIPIREEVDGSSRFLVDFVNGKPLYLTTCNVNAAITTHARTIQQTPYSLDGGNVMVGVWDSGSVLTTHQEFGSRVTVMDGSAEHFHASHVAGTIAAAGVDPLAKGMAPAASIRSYDSSYDITEMTGAAATLNNQLNTKLYLSNHSYSFAVGWSGTPLTWTDNRDLFGKYQSASANLDTLLASAPYYLPFFSAGNERNDNPTPGGRVVIDGQTVTYDPAIHPAGDGEYLNGYGSIGPYGSAKNNMTIGAVADAVTAGQRDINKALMSSFSSYGPTDDGRIKRDVVANGEML